MVVSGQWPSGRRYVSEAQLNPSSEFTGDEMAYARMIRKPMAMPGGPGGDGEDGEFTVKLLKVGLLLALPGASERFSLRVEFKVLLPRQEEGLKLTFSKQALMPNGSSGESSRKKHKDQEVRVRVRLGGKFKTLPIYPTYFQLISSQLSYSDGVHDPLERTPRRRDPPTWLKENPDYEVEGDMLEVRSTL